MTPDKATKSIPSKPTRSREDTNKLLEASGAKLGNKTGAILMPISKKVAERMKK